MKKGTLFIGLLVISLFSIGQTVYHVRKEKAEKGFENIHVKKLSDSNEQTSFLIWVRNDVRLHKHVHHTENIFVLSGKGEMTIGDEKFVIQKGDYFTIPKNTPHALKVLSSKPVKVLSIQSPQFKGVDRVYINRE